jgi:hypothetical protein
VKTLALSLALFVLPGEEVRLEAPPLTLDLPELDGLARADRVIGDLVAVWTGLLGECEVRIQVAAVERARFGLAEPEELAELFESSHAERFEREGRAAAFGAREPVEGDFGWIPFASLVSADVRERTAVTSRLWMLCGLTEAQGWAVQVEATPPPQGKQADALLDFLREGVRCAGEPRAWEWTEEEVEQRWREYAPEDALDKLDEPIRTEHYVIIGNSSGSKAFARKMEECYDTIQEIFPFPEVPGRKLMPVFLFRTPEQYFAFFSKRASIPLEKARRSKGHAYLDYYATWYEAPNDPVHIHEATHQIFRNRLYLSGGGSWLQEGVAEYVETRPNERNGAERLVRKGRHTPLRQFVAIESLLMSAAEDVKGGNEAGDHYKQAALLIEFLRESRFGKARFEEFLHAAGSVPRNDVEAIEQVTRRVYAVDLDGLDAEWQAWAKKR